MQMKINYVPEKKEEVHLIRDRQSKRERERKREIERGSKREKALMELPFNKPLMVMGTKR